MPNLAHILKVICDPTRLKILEALSSGPLCVSAIADNLGVTQSAVSQHLRLLHQIDLVTAEKRGYWVHYGLDRERLRALSSQFEDWCERLLARPFPSCAETSKCRKSTGRRSAGAEKGVKKK